MRRVIYGALVSLIVTAASAAEKPAAGAAEDMESANYMLPYCRLTLAPKEITDKINVFSFGRCYGVATATVAMYQQMRYYEAQGKTRLTPDFCADIPPNVTTGQALQAVIEFADAHSKDLASYSFQSVTMIERHRQGRGDDGL